MIELQIDGITVGVFPSLYACWKPLNDRYAALPEQYDTSINWRLFRDDGACIDSRSEYDDDEKEFQGADFQHPDGLPAGLWYALAEDAVAFNTYFKKIVGWSISCHAAMKKRDALVADADAVRELQEGVDFEGVSYD